MTRFPVILAAALTACTPLYQTEHVGTQIAARVIDPTGGFVGHHYAAWQEIWTTSHYTIVDGPCVSACAFFALARPGDCYTGNASLSVHPVGIAGMVPTDGTRSLTASLVANMPPELQAWWREHNPNAMGVTLGIDDLRAIMPGRECREEA